MRHTFLALALVTSSVTPALANRSTARLASANPTAAVRSYFQALDHQDFARALALTDGAAQARTEHMVGELKQKAAAYGARIEVRVRRLAVAAPGELQPGRGVPVPVQFKIDVIGHKWLFHKVARSLDGTAQFFVDPGRLGRIVAIEGDLD
jgi:hypothetical protein